jgi:hypothetical protein
VHETTETKRHLECKHPEYSSKPIDFFVNKKNELSSTKKIMKSALSKSSSNKNLVLASYEVSKLIAETGYPHTICEKVNTSCTENYYIVCLWKKARKSVEFVVSVQQYSEM